MANTGGQYNLRIMEVDFVEVSPSEENEMMERISAIVRTKNNVEHHTVQVTLQKGVAHNPR